MLNPGCIFKNQSNQEELALSYRSLHDEEKKKTKNNNFKFSALLVQMFKNQTELVNLLPLSSGVKNPNLMKKVTHEFSAL